MHTYVAIQLIGKTTSCEADAKRNPLDLPPKPKQKTPAPSQTATADDVPQEPSNKLRQYNSAPLQTSPDTSTPAESTESDGDGDTNNADTSDDDGTNEEKQVTLLHIIVYTLAHTYMLQLKAILHMQETHSCGLGFLP